MVISLLTSLMAAFTGVIGGSWFANHYIEQKVQQNIERRMGIKEQRKRMLEKKMESKRQQNLLSQNEALRRPFTRDLYIAGIRFKDSILIIEAVSHGVLILPVVFFFAMQVTGSLSNKNILMLLFISAACFLGPKNWLKKKKLERQNKIESEIAQFMDLLVVSVESGVGLIAAVKLILDEVGDKTPLTQEFKVLQQEYHGGVPLHEACDRLAKRCEIQSISLIMGNIIQSEKMGTSLGETLRGLASEMREKHRQNLRERAQKIPNLILMPTALIFISLMMVTLGPPVHDLAGTFAEMKK